MRPLPGDAGGLRAANARLRELLAERDAQITELRLQVAAGNAENVVLREQLEHLAAQVADLAARVSKHSKNSSKPPSSDGLGKPAPQSLRKKTGRGPGRPKGQPGVTMELIDHPDHVVRHEPACCAGCGAGLGQAPQTGMERRQVTEIPPVKAQVTEHQMIERQCSCGTGTRADAAAGLKAPVQYGPRASVLATYLWHGQFLSRDRVVAALGDMFGCGLSPSVIAAMARKIAGCIAPALEQIIKALPESEVAHFDETGFRVAGKLTWVHSASSGKYVLVTVHPKRGTAGMDAAGVLPSFAGIVCHDAWAPYDTYGGVAGHALCNSHVLRELVAVTQTGTDQDLLWAQQGIDALLALKDAADAARTAGHQAISAELLARQCRYNNEAERVIRMAKLRIKVSGCMRSMTGARDFCAIRSCLATATRHGISRLDALIMAAEGNPWMPTAATV